MKPILTIAGHDASNGAGITKDLEVFSFFGLHGISVPTAFVVQGPHGATGLAPVPMAVFEQMLSQVSDDFSLAAIKIGVTADEDHVRAVAQFLRQHSGVPVVLDPVMEAKNGLKLTTGAGMKELTRKVFPFATCVTPNIDEAEALLKRKIRDVAAMEEAARALADLGPNSVLLKGGHLADNPVDVFFYGDQTTSHQRRRMDRVLHGTGCMLSSSFASFLALGYGLKAAFRATEKAMTRFLAESDQPAAEGYHYAFPSAGAALWNGGALRMAHRGTGDVRKGEKEPAALSIAVGVALRAARGADDEGGH